MVKSIYSILLFCVILIPNQKEDNEALFMEIRKPEIDWNTNKLENLNQSDKDFLIENLKFGCSNEPNELKFKNFRKIDLNKDGQMDIIFKDACPYSELSIFIQTNEGYQKVIPNRLGVLTSINVSKDKTTLRIKQEACCCIRSNAIYEVSFYKNKGLTFDEQFLFWDYDFDLPENLSYYDNKIRRNKSRENVRTNPERVNEIIKDDCADIEFNGNKIGIIKKGAKYRLIATKKDKTGNDWELIEVLSNKHFKSDPNSIQSYRENKTITIGWIEK